MTTLRNPILKITASILNVSVKEVDSQTFIPEEFQTEVINNVAAAIELSLLQYRKPNLTVGQLTEALKTLVS